MANTLYICGKKYVKGDPIPPELQAKVDLLF